MLPTKMKTKFCSFVRNTEIEISFWKIFSSLSAPEVVIFITLVQPGTHFLKHDGNAIYMNYITETHFEVNYEFVKYTSMKTDVHHI